MSGLRNQYPNPYRSSVLHVVKPKFPTQRNSHVLLGLIPPEYSIRYIFGGMRGLVTTYSHRDDPSDTLHLYNDMQGRYEIGKEEPDGLRTGVWSRWQVGSDEYSVSTWRKGVAQTDWAPQAPQRLVKAAGR